MRALITFVATIVIFTMIPWTQREEHVTVSLHGPCMPLAGAQMDGNLCVYSDVTIEGSLSRRELDITDSNGITASVVRENIVSTIRNPTATAGFTWRTYTLFVFLLSIFIWSILPDIIKWVAGRKN